MHHLPHAPRHQHGHHLPRLHLVGQRGGRPGHVPEGSRRSSRAAERDEIQRANPEGAALRGLWSDRDFLADVSTLNPQLKNTQFADFHGHGWVFRAVFKKDRKGTLLDAAGQAGGRRRPREVQEGRPPEGHPPREGDALRGLPLQAGQPRRRQALRRAAGRGRDRLHRLPRHDQGGGDPGHHRPRLPRHRPLRPSPPPSASRASPSAAARSRRRAWSPRASSGRSGRWWTRSPPATRRYSEKSRPGQDHPARRPDLGRPRGRRQGPRPRQRQHDLLRLPLGLDHQLLRLPPLA